MRHGSQQWEALESAAMEADAGEYSPSAPSTEHLHVIYRVYEEQEEQERCGWVSKHT